jgi:hypothetical protein
LPSLPGEYEAGWALQLGWAFWRRYDCLFVVEKYAFSVFGPNFLEEYNQVEVYTHYNSSGGITTGIRIEQSMNRGSIPDTCKRFFLVSQIRHGCGAQQVRWPIGIWGLVSAVNEANHLSRRCAIPAIYLQCMTLNESQGTLYVSLKK